jgi:NAD(P) transhydrogenase subunit alpha
VKIGVPKETADGERRVALVPEVVRKLANPPGEDAHGSEVLVERGAGEGAMIPDSQYE